VSLTAKQEELGQQTEWDFGLLRALFINCTSKRSPELSHTQGLTSLVHSGVNHFGYPGWLTPERETRRWSELTARRRGWLR
jgi:hypothetical protein